MKAEEIAEIISSPISHQFFTRNTAEDLIISCKYDWFIDYILDSLNLRSDEAAILEKKRLAIKAAREGVADIMKEQSEAIIKLDSRYKDGGGYFMLGAVHLKSPYIPFLLSWPDKDKAVEHLNKAVNTGEATLVQKRYLAHALYKTGKEEQAVDLLNQIINSTPSQDEYIEDLDDIREAKLLLKSF